MIKIIDVKYPGGHTGKKYYQKQDYFCPGCGKKTVWEEVGGGDYYVGNEYACASCEHLFYLPSFQGPGEDYKEQIIKELRAAECDT